MPDTLAEVMSEKGWGVRTRIYHKTITWPVDGSDVPLVPPWGVGAYPVYDASTEITQHVEPDWSIHVSEDVVTSLRLRIRKDQATAISYNDVITIERQWTSASYDTGWVMVGWGLVQQIADGDPLVELTCYGPLVLLKNANFPNTSAATGTLAGDTIEEDDKTLTQILGSASGDPAYEFVDANHATWLDAAAASGQAVVPVTDTTPFEVGDTVTLYSRADGDTETAEIDSISAGVSLTMTANLTNDYASGDDCYVAGDYTYNWAMSPPPKITAVSDGKVVLAEEIQVLYGEGIVRINTEYYEEDMDSGGVEATYERYATSADAGYDANLVVAALTGDSRLEDVLLAAGFQTQSSAAPFYLSSLPNLTTAVYIPPLYYRLDEGRTCHDVYRDLQKFLPPNFRLTEGQDGSLAATQLVQAGSADYSIAEPRTEPRRDRDAGDLYTAVLVKGYSHTAGNRRNLAWKAGGATITALETAMANGFSGTADDFITDGIIKVWNVIDGTGKKNCKWAGTWTLAGTETGDPFEDVDLFKIDLGESYSIEQLLIMGGTKTVGPHGTLTLAVYASTDDVSYTLVVDNAQPGEVTPDGGDSLILSTTDFVAEGAFTARYLKVRCLQSWQRIFGLDNETDRWQAFSFSGKRLDAKIELREFEVFGSPLLEAEAILGTTSPYDTADDKALAARIGRRWFIVPDTYYGLDQAKDIDAQQADLEAYAALWLGELKREFAPYRVKCMHQAVQLGDTVTAGAVTGVVIEYELSGDDMADLVAVDYGCTD